MSKLKNTFKTDILFKTLFVKYPELLKRLTAHILKIPFECIDQFQITSQEMPPEIIRNKFCRLDILMIVEGQQVNLEVQVEDEKNFTDRAMYYWARIYSNALPSIGKYADLPRTIIVSILAFNQFPCKEFYSEYLPLEKNRYTVLSDKMVFIFYELLKLPDKMNKDDLLLLWLTLFKADTEEEFARIEAWEVPELKQAIRAYHSVTASSEFQELERLRAKAQHDEAQALYNAENRGKAAGRAEGRAEGVISVAKKLLLTNLSIDSIITATGLTISEVENLRDAD